MFLAGPLSQEVFALSRAGNSGLVGGAHALFLLGKSGT